MKQASSRGPLLLILIGFFQAGAMLLALILAYATLAMTEVAGQNNLGPFDIASLSLPLFSAIICALAWSSYRADKRRTALLISAAPFLIMVYLYVRLLGLL